MSSFVPCPAWASPASEIPGTLVALDPKGNVALIDVGRRQGVTRGDVVIVSEGQGGDSKILIQEVFSDAAKINLSAEVPSLAEGTIIKVIPAPLTPAQKIQKIFREKVTGSVSTGFNYVNHEGHARKSFRERGFHYFEEVDLTYRDRVAEKMDVELSGNFRVTDDAYLQPETFSGRRLQLAVTEKDNRYGIVLGDSYTYFSHYSMSQTLKGVKVHYKQPWRAGETKLTAVVGTNKDRWEEFYENLDGEPFNRVVTGTRLEHRYKDLIVAGFNFVDSRDDDGSDGPATASPVTNDLFSFDLQTHFWNRLNVAAEGAYAYTDTDGGRVVSRTKPDNAVKIDSDLLVTNFEYFTNRIYYGYERAGQNFSSLSGILKTDRQENYLRHKMDIGDYLSVKYQFNRFWDNLKDGSATSTKTAKNEIDVILRPFTGRPGTEFEVDMYKTKNESTDQASTTDSGTESIYMKASNKIRRVTVWTGFKIRRRHNDVALTSRRWTRMVDVGFRGDWNWKDIYFSPHLSFEYERDEEPTAHTRRTMVRPRMGGTIRTRSVQLSFTYLSRNENDRILTHNVDRYYFEIDGRYYVRGNSSHILSVNFLRDDLDAKLADREYKENMLTVKYTERFG